MAKRPITEDEIAVIDAAQELVNMWEASHYGPAGKHVKAAEKALIDAMANLASEHDGRWEPPRDA